MAALAGHLDAPRQVRLALAQGRFQFSHSEYDAARGYADRAAELAERLDHAELRAEATLLQGKALTWASDGEGARAALTRAEELSRTIGRPALLGESLRYLGMLASNIGDYAASLQYAAQAREVFARAGDTELEGTALAQEAITYFNLGRYDEAQTALEATLPIFRRSGHRYRETINLGNLASISLMRGRLAESERWGHEALGSARELEELEPQATYSLVLGSVAALTGRPDLARTHLERAITIAHEVRGDALEGEALARLATTELLAGNPEQALDRARGAVAASSEVASELDRGYTHLSRGYAATALGLWDEAEAAFTEAHTLFSHLELESLVREAVVGLARVTCGRGRTGAVAMIEPVLEHLDQTGLSQTWHAGELLRSVHRILAEAGDPRAGAVREQARAYLQAMAEEVGDPALAAGFRALPPHAELLADT
jgi:tetratricopeptide (TPR) repeat protein